MQHLSHRTFGTGSPMLVLPGLLGMADNWLSFAKKMAEHFKIYLIDLRNHGNSFQNDDFSYETMVEDIRCFINQHKIENPIILGHSMGGKLAMQFAQTFPAMVKKLLVVDMAPRAYAMKDFDVLLRGLRNIDLSTLETRGAIKDKLKTLTKGDLKLVNFLAKGVKRTTQGSFRWRANIPILSDKINEIARAVTFKQPFFKPTLFIRGAKSDYVHDEDTSLMKKLFPRFRLETIPLAGHWVQAEQPQLFLEVVEKFLLQSTKQ